MPQRDAWCCGVCQFPRCDAVRPGENVTQRAMETILSQGYPLGDLQPSELFGRLRGRCGARAAGPLRCGPGAPCMLSQHLWDTYNWGLPASAQNADADCAACPYPALTLPLAPRPLPRRMLWMLGDSINWGFYQAIECFLRGYALDYVRRNITNNPAILKQLHQNRREGSLPVCLNLQDDTKVGGRAGLGARGAVGPKQGGAGLWGAVCQCSRPAVWQAACWAR